jgi:hypothetical protein
MPWRPLLRDFFSYTIVLVALVVFSLFAWTTRHPDAVVLDRFLDWPLLGKHIERLRAAQAAEREHDAARGAGVKLGADGERSAAAGRRGVDRIFPILRREVSPPNEDETAAAAFPPKEGVWLLPGNEIRSAALPDAEVVEKVSNLELLALVERRGEWLAVGRSGKAVGWVRLPGYFDHPPLGLDPAPPRPLPGREPEPALLSRGTALLGTAARSGSLGPWGLLTDLDDDALLVALDQAASGLESAYRQRYGLELAGRARESVVLFAREEPYRRFQNEWSAIAGVATSGHAGHGIVALYTGERARGVITATLLHELIHTLNRRALGPALPPWLDEGLADELSQSPITGGELVPGDFVRLTTTSGDRVVLFGALASLQVLLAAMGGEGLPSFTEVLAADYDVFTHSQSSGLYYAMSAFWIRYLLGGESGRSGEGLRAFLRHIAGGGDVTVEALERHLGRRLFDLEAGFRAWLLQLGAAEGLRPLS